MTKKSARELLNTGRSRMTGDIKVIFADLLPGETPIDDITGLKIPGVLTRRN